MTTSTLPLVIPEFNFLKAGFIEYLSAQPEYTDYNFAGSGLSTLLDVHALNTHYLAFYLNQVGNESFLDTAIKRSSIVSRAKGLGYIPKTSSAASCRVQLEFIKEDKNTPFTDITLQGVTLTANYLNSYYIFSTTNTITIREINNRFISKEFTVYEGKRLTSNVTITEELQSNGFIIPNANVDISHVSISVKENNVSTNYSIFTNIIDISESTKGFFYHENADGKLVIEFGDNNLGYMPPIGSIMTITYLVCSGESANNIDGFNIIDVVQTGGQFLVGTVFPSSGGGDAETNESIKKLAPLSFTSQNRAVTDKDYVTILKTKYPNIEDVIAYGGETLNPPKYGKVIVVVKLKSGLYLTTYDKLNIASDIKKYNVTTVTPIIMEPDYVFLNLTINVLYKASQLTDTIEALRTKVRNSVSTYQDTFLSGFDRDFRYSTFLRLIDFSDKSVVSNNTEVLLEKKLTPVLGTRTFIDTSFNNPLLKGSLITSPFTYNKSPNCFIDDSLNGILAIYQYKDNIKKVIASNFGTIDYITGDINIPAITIDRLDGINNINTQTNELYFSIYAVPINNDVIINKTNIAEFSNISILLTNIED